MFSGLSAFPLTPVNDKGIDEKAFLSLLSRLTAAKVNSLGVLGSTGSYAYFTREQRQRVTKLAVDHAENIPVMVSIGATSTDEVLRLAEDAQQAGVSALLLPAVSYQKLTEEEIFGLYKDVAQHASVPVCVYDNPGTTHTAFTDALYARIAALDAIASIKIPGVPDELGAATQRVSRLRSQLPGKIRLGVSGDASAGNGLIAGCDVWYSVCGGLFPNTALGITRAAQAGDFITVAEQSQRLEPLWTLFRKHGGSIRVMAAAAALLGLTSEHNLPRPVRSLSIESQEEVRHVIDMLGLH